MEVNDGIRQPEDTEKSGREIRVFTRESKVSNLKSIAIALAITLLVAGISFAQQVELQGDLELVPGSLEIKYRLGNYGGEYLVRGEIINRTNYLIAHILVRITMYGGDGVLLGVAREVWPNRSQAMKPGETRSFYMVVDTQLSRSKDQIIEEVKEENYEIWIQFIPIGPHNPTSRRPSSWGMLKLLFSLPRNREGSPNYRHKLG